ncbi:MULTISPECIES: CpaF family protein [Idiomarina]|jgi:pilus assembly protein CpaF|uniref:Possible Flp pilus assembly protein CpaF n=5 Tax=Idiomarina baltica TaxID=190892 RepID=A0ABP2CQI6_9GAMM|nr:MULTISPECIES: CpaF family protein [Idiomarina]EAQ32099.1 possible Flp pilus assembly protein CpaF [Idiomarina baltica OS145]KXS36046.1 MAG: pilus assembly protein CpaF [Idiomarina sp. T82-3]MBL74416.1 CpaF family protein [Idiomarinaceae bacterium]MBR37823.1 CpaF family protein [Idiomarina sp.]|tara:strand:+ start:7375 stop:8586 length:1212 start_codon:yes stop_codon:yes gene_type:complete
MNKQQLRQALKNHLQQRQSGLQDMPANQLREHAKRYLLDLHSQQSEVSEGAVADVIDEVLGLGPIETLLRDDSVSEIMVNRHDQIFIERSGRLADSGLTFSDEPSLRRVIERIVLPLGRHIDDSSPMVDARLPDGSRVNAVLQPLAVKGSCITIRKFSAKPLTIDDLINYKSLSPKAAEFLKLAVECRQNIIISGGTGSGKTTLLNTLSSFIPSNERIVTIEDAAELRLQHQNLVSLEARPKNQEGKGAIHIRDLVINSLRMRPDRIVVGECRGAEALDMLQAMNTGHAGSLSTVHANTARDAVRRLEIMVLMGSMDLPVFAIRQQIASAVDIIVQTARLSTGERVVTSIDEVTGIDGETLQIGALFARERGKSGLVSQGMPARFAASQASEVKEKIAQTLME